MQQIMQLFLVELTKIVNTVEEKKTMWNWLKNLVAMRSDIPAREPAPMAPPAAEPKKKPARKPTAKKAAAPKRARKPKQ